MPSRRLLALIALVAAFACGLAAEDSAHAEAGPLTITLKGPAVCETDADTFYFDIDTVPIAWSVSGGSPPYEVLINGEVFNQSSGEVNVACGRRRTDYGFRRVTSGITTVQATVADAAGRSASALHDLYGILSVRYKDWSAPGLHSGETYRVHGLLFTVPSGLWLKPGSYLSDDCATRDEHCGDRFSLSEGGGWAGYVSIYRWSGEEHARVLGGESGRSRVYIRKGDDVKIPRWYEQLNDTYDELIASIGKPPNSYAKVPSGGPASGRMSLTLEMPAICNRGSDLMIPVSWSVAGGRAPYEVTIEGDRYLGQRGVAEIHCVATLDKPQDSGRRRVQATAVDASGDTASARADLYVIEWRGSWRSDLTPGQTYNLEYIGRITIPQGVEAELDISERTYCTDPWPTPNSGCEGAIVITISIGGEAASITYGDRSGREYSRTVSDDASPTLIAKFEQLLASIDAPPTLPDDFIDASAPLWVSVAAVDHPLCSPGRNVSLDWIASGGRWWPLSGEIDSGSGWTYSREVPCDGEPGAREVQLRISESGTDPQTLVQPHTMNIVATQHSSGRIQFPDNAQCVIGQPIVLRWWAPGAAFDDAQFVVTLNGAQATVRPDDTFQLPCPAIAGRHFITVRPAGTGASPRGNIWSGMVYATSARPERAKP